MKPVLRLQVVQLRQEPVLLGVYLLLEHLPLYLSHRFCRLASACQCHSPVAQCQVDKWHPLSSQHMGQECPGTGCCSLACL